MVFPSAEAKTFAGLSAGTPKHGNVRNMRTDQKRGKVEKSSQLGKRKPMREFCSKVRQRKSLKKIVTS